MYLFGERILVMCVDGHVAMIFTSCGCHFFRRPVSTAEPDLKQLVEPGMDMEWTQGMEDVCVFSICLEFSRLFGL